MQERRPGHQDDEQWDDQDKVPMFAAGRYETFHAQRFQQNLSACQ